MVNEKDIIEQQIKNQQAAEEKDPLKVIEALEEREKLAEEKFAERERELLIKIAKQTEETKASRKLAAAEVQKAKVAEFKYINQQKQEIGGKRKTRAPKESETDFRRKIKT